MRVNPHTAPPEGRPASFAARLLGRMVGPGLGQQTVLSLGVMAANVGLAFGLSVLLARLLGAAQYGHYAYLMVWLALLVNVAVLGVDRLLVRDLAVFRARQDGPLLRGLWRWGNLTVLAASLGLAGLGSLSVWVLAGRLDADRAATFLVGWLALPLMALTLVRQAALQADGHSVAGQLPERIARPVLVAALSLLAAASGLTLTAPVAAGALVGASALALVLADGLARRLRPAVPAGRAEMQGGLWASGSLRLMVSTVLAIAGEQASLLLLGAYAEPAALGAYSVAVNGSRLVALGLLALNVPLGPVVARLHAQPDTPTMASVVVRSRRGILLVTLGLFAGLMLFQQPFLALFGPGFEQARLPLVILCLGQLVNGACGPVALLLAMTHHERDVVAAMGLNLGLSLALGLWLIPLYGAVGAAAATALALAAWNLFLTQRVRRRLGLNLWRAW